MIDTGSTIVSAADPAGALWLIDATTPPFLHHYDSVEAFLGSPYESTRTVDIVTITGVGSSALGSAALAWDVSRALGRPVLAIVPGYGVADVVQQALGGWFGFGLHDYLASKSLIQTALAAAQPKVAEIGRNLAATVPGAKTVRGAPVFRTGSGSSDALHALLARRETPFALLVGHSKGALQINNALRSLPDERTSGVRVVTLGCPIATGISGVAYHQYLGLFDALGSSICGAIGRTGGCRPGTAPTRDCRRRWRRATLPPNPAQPMRRWRRPPRARRWPESGVA